VQLKDVWLLFGGFYANNMRLYRTDVG